METRVQFDRLFIFEMANNHCGDVDHGLRIIREIKKACEGFDFQFAFKFQYRDLDTFIHPAFQDRDDIKYVKRFSETRLSEKEFLALKNDAENQGFLTVCTPFDEISVDRIQQHGYDIVKIASCSFTDWPLLEKIAALDKPVIASTASASLTDIDKVVSFFENRKKIFCLMHCVGAYPTLPADLQLNQIDLLRTRYQGVPIGFSTHEQPENLGAVKIAVAKKACVFERHVAVDDQVHAVNAYSSTPGQIREWLKSAQEAFAMCGVSGERYQISEKEKTDLQGLKRGVFAAKAIEPGEKLGTGNIFFAIPNQKEQLVANDISKYMDYAVTQSLKSGDPVLAGAVTSMNKREQILSIVQKIKDILVASHIAIPATADMELSHHYGIERYEEYGAAILNCINREYCKKLIVLLPGQKHPVHHHVKKEETFQVLFGQMTVDLEGEARIMRPGDMLTVERGAKHCFSSKDGAVFEEVSTTHFIDDSFYEHKKIEDNPNRKTRLTFLSSWLSKEIS